MTEGNVARSAELTIIISYLTSAGRNNFFFQKQGLFVDLANFSMQEQTEDNLMVAISRAWYNGSYTMAVKPIKFLELL